MYQNYKLFVVNKVLEMTSFSLCSSHLLIFYSSLYQSASCGHLEWFGPEAVPIYVEHSLGAVLLLCHPVHPRPSELGRAQVIAEARSCDAALLHSPSLLTRPHIAGRSVLSHCPVEKQIIGPTECKPDGVACNWRMNKLPPLSPAKYSTLSHPLHSW